VAREEAAMPKSLVQIYDRGDGTIYVLDAVRSSPEGEYPVIEWELGNLMMSPEEANVEAPDFGAFLLTLLREELEE
jgi:hypothetical protein